MKIIDQDPRSEVPYISLRKGDTLEDVKKACEIIGAIVVTNTNGVIDHYYIQDSRLSALPQWLTEEELKPLFPIPDNETLLEFINRTKKK